MTKEGQAVQARRAGLSMRALAAALWAGLAFAAASGTSLVHAQATSWAGQNIDISPRAIANVTDLVAQTGATGNTIDLTWTEPFANGHTLPTAYDIRVSTLSQLSNNGDFQAAPALAAFSGTPVPSPGPGGGQVLLVVTGLQPATTYYFAVRETDDSIPKLVSAWHRNVVRGWNVFNWALPKFSATAPTPVTDLVGFATSEGQALVQWTAPEGNDTPIPGHPAARYMIRQATFSVQDLGGNTTAWFDAATEVASVPMPLPPGSLQTLLISNLSPAVVHYFAIKSSNTSDLVSDIDARSYTVNQAKVDVRGIAGITNLSALPGTATGSVDLVWTQPRRAGQIEPTRYEVRVSSAGQISNASQFAAARPLTAFSDSTVPAIGTAGSTGLFTITGLVPGATYYFAMRARDSGASPYAGAWTRDVALDLNPGNWAVAKYTPRLPEAVTNLTALPGSIPASVGITWTAPLNLNGVPVTQYIVKMREQGMADLGVDATTWFELAGSTTFVVAAQQPGSLVSLEIDGLDFAKYYYFAMRSVDLTGAVSPIDVRSATVSDQPRTRPRPTPPIINLSAFPGTVSGSVDLAWTVPEDTGLVPPRFYDLRVSTTANISDNFQFEAAQPLSAFSRTPLPAPGPSGSPAALTLTGLVPNVTYYFALREYDSNPTPVYSDWYRSVAQGINLANFSAARYVPNAPDAVTGLVALTGSGEGQVALSWTAPRNENFVPISTYVVRMATFSIAQVGGSTSAWFDSAASGLRLLAPAGQPGSLETFTITGLDPGFVYWFAVKPLDREAELGPIDSAAAAVVSQASAPAKGVAPVTDLVARTGSSGAFGSVDLSWTEPLRAGATAPARYVLKVSAASNIEDAAAFEAAAPLSALSGTPLPAPGTAGATRLLTLTGLTPFTTYYFALRIEDSSAPVLKGRWLRDSATGWNLANWAQALFVPNPPEPVTDLAAQQGTVSEGDVRLSWTAPLNRNFVPISSYEVRFATFSADSLGGDTAAWLTLAGASVALKSPAGAPGALETLVLQGLHPASTFYFAVRALDRAAELSPIDTRAAAAGAQAFSKPLNLPPAVPSGLSAASGLVNVSVAWDALSAAGKGLDFRHYFLLRSTMPASDFSEVRASTGTSYLDRPLKAYTTYYFRLGARDQEGLESALTPAVAATPFSIAPMQPFGFRLSTAPAGALITWNDTVRFSDGTPFTSTTTPTTDELSGYEVFRTTDYCGGLERVAFNAVGVASTTHLTGETGYYYVIRSTNDWFVSRDSLFLSPFGDHLFVLDDCVGRVELEHREALLLNKESTGLAEDIAIVRRHQTEAVGGKVMQSAEFKPMLGGVTELKDFHFPKAVRVILHYATDAEGRPVPQASGLSAASAKSQGRTVSAASAGEAARNLGMFWNNGVEFKKLYGKVDAAEQTVTAETPNLGQFQIRSLYRDSGATFDLSNLTSRVLTPNGDHKNDLIIFTFDNPRNASITGKVYDLRGAFVANMQPGPERGLASNQLVWDGTMNGRVVTSGVYVYQIEGEGRMFNGTLVVAR